MRQAGGFSWDLASGRFDWSPGAEAALGVACGELPDFESWKRIVEPDDLDGVLAVIETAIAERRPWFPYCYRTRTRDVAQPAVEGLAHCQTDDSGRVVSIVGVNIDTSNRVRREAELLASAARLRSIMDTVPDTMLIADADGIIRDISASGERMFGYAAADLCGRSVDVIIPPLPGDPALPFAALLDRVEGSGRRVLTARHRDGRAIPIEIFLGEAVAGDYHLLTGFIRDVSDRIAAEERLADMRHDLLQVSRLSAMGELAAGLAHELNQPLGAAANYLGTASLLLRRGASHADIEKPLQQAITQTLRTGQIIQRMRAFVSRGESEMTAVAVADVVADAVTLMLVGGGQYDIRLVSDFADDAALLRADRIQIQQVLVNLLRNAIDELKRSRREERQIDILSRRIDERMIQISVEDNGPGFAPAIIESLYSNYASTKERGHMGVGLSISRRIVEAHGGRLTARNRPGGGASVRFTVPAIDL